jgi:hypothetical protein
MATRIYEIVRFVAVPGSGQTTLPHSINVNGLALIPDRADRSNGNFTIDAVTATDVTVTNTGGLADNCDIWLEFEHSITREFGASQTLFLVPRPFVSAAGSTGNTGDPMAFRFTATGAEGSDFLVTLPTPRGTDIYRVQGTLAGVTSIVGFDCPDTLAGDRTTTQFRVITSASVTVGDKIDFYVSDDF